MTSGQGILKNKAPVTLYRIAFHTGLPQPNPIRKYWQLHCSAYFYALYQEYTIFRNLLFAK